MLLIGMCVESLHGKIKNHIHATMYLLYFQNYISLWAAVGSQLMHGPGHGPSDDVHLVRQLPRQPRGGAQHHLQGGQQRRLVHYVGSMCGGEVEERTHDNLCLSSFLFIDIPDVPQEYRHNSRLHCGHTRRHDWAIRS